MWIFLLVFISKLIIISTNCQSGVFCTGKLLHTIQMANIYRDSKVFVDMRLIYQVEKTINDFNDMMIITNEKPNVDEVRNFVHSHFEPENSELELWQPPDYKTNPRFLKQIDNATVRSFAKELSDLWAKLGRRIKYEVIEHADQYSIIPVPHGFIVPGGRFREFYYWDSFWIIKGLLICDMRTTAKGMLDNLFYMVETYGFIPNGGRIYYLDRSQPPVLTMMVEEYFKRTNDKSWLKQSLPYLDKELHFWLDNRCRKILKNGRIYLMAYYQSTSYDPRPESYVEDIHSASTLRTMKEKQRCYRAIRSGAESGWDFSTRWSVNDENITDNRYHVTRIDPTRIIPVDLNAMLARSFRLFSGFHSKFGNNAKAKYWMQHAEQFEEAIRDILYSKSKGIWLDYDYKSARKRNFFYPTNLTPLWTRSFNDTDHRKYCRSARQYLLNNSIFDYDGGVPTSLADSGEQWDLPNAWAPLQSIMIFGLEQCNDYESRRFAKLLAYKWLRTNYDTYQKSSEMYEKYNVLFSGVSGGGGEYEVQTGFGWSNGVILELIEYYYIRNKIFT